MRIFYFSLAFVIPWSFAIVFRIWKWYNGAKNMPHFIDNLYNLGINSVGLCNAIVWATSDLWKSYNKLTSIDLRERLGTTQSILSWTMTLTQKSTTQKSDATCPCQYTSP